MTIPLQSKPAAAGLASACLLSTDVPPELPLRIQPQDLARPFTDPAAPQRSIDSNTGWWRAGVILATVSLTIGLSHQMAVFLAAGGMSGLEWLVLALYALTFVWIAFALVTALVGAVVLIGGKDDPSGEPPRSLRVALLVLIYNEPPARVFGNATAMLSTLAEAQSRHRYDLFVLSDTNHADLAGEEAAAFRAAQALLQPGALLYYRRRARNTGRKVGNISDWLCRWGGAYEAFLVLDADSIMSAQAIHALTDELARDESLGLVQSVPRIIGAQTLFARIQQFSGATVGSVMAAGAATWMGTEANYFGHNAILRTGAFAVSANLPLLPGKPPFGGNILSHDFVEAAMLRRAGWSVRMIPLKDGSYEETPPSLIDYVLRDRRWCQGNLQHLLVLTTAGFHPVSRFHLLQGIMTYLVSPFWVLFLVCGVGAQVGDGMLLTANQSIEAGRGLAVLTGTLLILLAPKLVGIWGLAVIHGAKHCGGITRLLCAALLEIVLSSIIAPILMVQQTLAVLRVILGVDGGWCPQRREAAERSWITYVQFHAAETALGLALVISIITGLISNWLWPIAASLLVAVPLSRLSSIPVGDPRILPPLFATPEDVVKSAVIARSLDHAQRIVGHGEVATAPLEVLQAAE